MRRLLSSLTLLLLAVFVSGFDGPINPPAPMPGGPPASGLHFGRAVDIHGDDMAVANDDVVRIYRRTSAGWLLQAQVEPHFMVNNVQICGDVLAVGNAFTDLSIASPGVAIYEQDTLTGLWALRAELRDPTGRDGTWGSVIDLDANVLVVGGYSVISLLCSGNASVFERRITSTGSGWVLREQLNPPFVLPAPGPGGWMNMFGMAVAVSGQTLAVAGLAPPTTPEGWGVSKVWLYRRNITAGMHWVLDGAPLVVPASMLALDGDTLAVGNWRSGLVLYQRRPAGWTLQTTINMTGDGLWSMAMEGGQCAVRGLGDYRNSEPSGVPTNDNVGIIERSAGAWNMRQSLLLTQSGINLYGGQQTQLLALDGGTLVCGEPNRAGILGGEIGRVAVATMHGANFTISEDIAPPQVIKMAKLGTTPPVITVVPMGNDVDRVVVTASGAAILGTVDQCGYVPFTLAGDGDIVARVISQKPATTGYTLNATAKAGLMFRESLAPGARNIVMALMPSGLMFQWREFTNGLTTLRPKGAAAAPLWLKLARKGASVAGYSSHDGVTWTMQGVRPFITGTIHAGLVVNNTAAQAATVVFDGVRVTPLPAAAVAGATAPEPKAPSASGLMLAPTLR
jgi:hypothetical protein